MASGIYFTGFQSWDYFWFLPGLFLIITYFFYLPVTLAMGIVYSILPRMNPDMDTMTASQFTFYFGLRFVLSCVYAYLVSCAILHIYRKKKIN